jgi:RHS repeat-associated protein
MAHRRWRLKLGVLFTILALLLAAPAASPDKIHLPLILNNFDAEKTPLAFNDQYQVDEGGTLNGSPGVLANDQDPKARPLTAVLVTEVGHGSLTFNLDGTFTYTPISDFNGTDSFTYKAYNGLFYSSVAMVRITVIPINGPPVAVPDVVEMTQTVAQAAIIAAKLAVGTVSTALSGTVPKDSVISQNPLAGASVSEGTSVSLVVSLGPGVTVPSVVGMIQSAAESAITTAGLTVGTITEENNAVPAGNVIGQNPAGGTLAAPGSPVNLTISLGPLGPPLPPDPSLVAPPLNLTVPTSVFTATEFLYTGTNPIQTGVTPGTIEAKRAAVLRGLVTNRDGAPLSGAAITILNHPEYGQTRSRLDGMFDLVVNGGGLLTVKYEKEGYLKAQRQADVPWQDLIWLPEVALIPFDAQTTAIDLSAPGLQSARGTQQTDASGTRQATVLFPPGNQGTMVMPDGSTQPLNSFTLRATEYSVGPNGPQAMPAPLPPNVGYTYCVELTADEAEQAGASRVQFSQPLYYYLENFLGFPVGSIVPSGYYDRQKAAWVPSPNGLVIKIVSVSAEGLADLDLNNTPGADPTLYLSLGITDAERRQLATLYTIGQELWRVPVTHFTPYDLNWPAGLGVASDATLPNQAPPDQKKPDCDPCKQKGSILECQSQVLGQEIPIVGSPFSLNYRSSHVSGRTEAYTLDIPLSGPSVPDSLGQIKLEVRVAGKLFKRNFSKAPNLSYTFIWDGKDAYGRIVQGRQPVYVRIGYEYPAVYDAPKPLNSSFGSSLADATVDGPSGRQDITLWQEWKGQIGTWLSLYQGLGGFSLDAHHFYDRKGGILFRGDGGEYNAEAIASQVATRYAGGVWEEGDSPSVNGIPAIEAHIAPSGIAAGPDGSIYVTHHYTGIIHILGFPEPTVLKITPDGNISTLPGFPASTTLGDIVENVALGPDGSVYVSDTTGGIGHRVLRYDPITQTASAVAGIQGTWGSGCNECPANTSPLFNPRGITLSQDGTLYIADTTNQVVRKVDLNGIITTVAGIMGQAGFSGDNGPASSAKLNSPYGLALGPDGSLYVADTNNFRVRRVGPDGIITTVAGTNIRCPSEWVSCGDGGPASQAQLSGPMHVSVGLDGSLFITDGARVRRVSTTGIISALLSDPAAPPSVTWRYGGEGGPPARLFFGSKQTAVGPDGSLYVSGGEGGVVLKIHAPLKGLDFGEFIVPSTDGSELYVFNAAGRHDRTLNANTNSIIFQFYYDSEGRLIKVDDAYGNSTLIERNGSAPAAIIGPFGQRTQLTVNGNGYLASISGPGGQTTSFTYKAGGLMTGMTEPKGNAHAFTYEADGRLTQDKDPDNNIQTLTRSEFDTGYSVVHSTAEGHQTTYRVERLSNGNQRQTNTFPTGAITTNNLSTNGSETLTFADGSTSIPSKTPDPRFGLRSPLYKTTLKMPSNLEFNSESKRTVTLSDPSDLLSVQTITEETTFCPGCPDPRTYRLTYSAADKKYTHNTAEWRSREIIVNDQGSITRIDVIPGDYGMFINPVTFTYNSQGFLMGTAFGDTSRTFNYDALGRVETTVNAARETIRYGYDAANKVTALTSPLGNRYGFNYDVNNKLTQIIMPSNAAHGFSYNSLNLLSGYTPPGVGQSPYSWIYNKDRDLALMTLPGERSIDIGYDTGGRISQVSYPEATVKMSYNDVTDRFSRIRLTPLSGPAQQMDYTYDGSLLKSAIYSGVANGTYTYTYDNNYFLTGLGFVSGADSVTIPIIRDKDGLVTRYGDFNFGREETLGLLTAIGSGTHTLQINYTYDALGRLASRTHTVNGIQIYDLQLTRDNTGRITQKADGSTYDYVYDKEGRLNEVHKDSSGNLVEEYTYDANGNRISTRISSTLTASAQYDVQDRITGQGVVTYQHNADGFMTQRGSDTLVYSTRGELLQTTVDSTTVTYAYDGYGRRVGRNTGSGTWYQYLYADPLNAYPVTATRDPDSVLTTYHYDDFGHLFAFRRGGVWYYVATDQVGTPRVVSDAIGTILKTLDYDSYGVLIADSNPGFDLPIGFAGGISDPVTGLVRFGARDYDPVIGRWTAKDPILFPSSSSNLYAYVSNNPIQHIDPRGLEAGGLIAEGNVELGIPDYSGGINIGVGSGLFLDSNGKAQTCIFVNVGCFLKIGGRTLINYPGKEGGAKGCALGATAGVSAGGWYSNASSVQDFSGAASNMNLNTPTINGTVGTNGELGKPSDKDINTVTVTVGPSLGGNGSSYQTNTIPLITVKE